MAKTDVPTGNRWQYGHLHAIDELPHGDPRVGPALNTYAHHVDVNRQSRHWKRSVIWMENIFFGMGRHYVDDILISRLSRDSSSGDLSIIRDTTQNIPRPTNDILGRYIETNIALLTENRPRPRITPKSDRRDDRIAAELSELTMEYLWEELDLPEKHREIARLLLYCGVAWLEICYDPLQPRHMTVPQTEEETGTIIAGPEGRPITAPIRRQVTKLDKLGRPVLGSRLEYGDIIANVVSPFEMHLPVAHWWNGDEMGWIMKESYTAIDVLKDHLGGSKQAKGTTKKNGWFLENLDKVSGYNVQNLPLWWWERLSDLVEGPGPSLYVGTPEQWSGYTVVRTFDRKPSKLWPRGRTIVTAGDQVIYDSPKEIGARAYDPRWPKRWHPYIRYRWEGQPGTIYGRSLVSKILPKLKRINSIDTTLIMWRRTVPIAAWLIPKGAHPVEDFFTGRPGPVWEYDPRRTMQQEPKPIYPPDYPRTALEERETQLAEIEAIAGTEEILRGQRPRGVNSAAMLDALRRQALASRSAILQAWDESVQNCGTSILQEVIKHVREDTRYAERLRVLAREKTSRLSIQTFSGEDISDNVVVRVDTASQAMVSKEARQARVIEFMQYLPALMQAPLTLQQTMIEELGFERALDPKGPDINRVKTIISWIKQGRFDLIIPFPEDDPYVFHEMLVKELKDETFFDLNQQQQSKIVELITYYREQIEMLQQQQMELMEQMGEEAGGGGEEG